MPDRFGIPLPEEVYNPYGLEKSAGEAFLNSLVQEINQNKAAKIKRQEQAYGLLKEMSGNKYYEAVEPIDWNNALSNPELEMGKFKRIKPADEQMIDVKTYMQGEDNKLTEMPELTRKAKVGTPADIIKPIKSTNILDEQIDYNTLDNTTKNLARNILKGKASIAGSSGFRDKQKLAKIVQAVSDAEAIPYDENLIKLRLQTRKDYTTGKANRNITSFNTAIGHIDSLVNNLKSLNNTGSPLLNKPYNLIRNDLLGNPKTTRAAINVDAVVNELSNAFKQTGATEQEIAEWRKNVTHNVAPNQIQGIVDVTMDLLSSRLNAVKNPWDTVFAGTGENFSQFVNPKAKSILKKYGKIDMIEDTITPNSFNSVQEAEAANLPIGTEIYINGRRAVIE